MAVAGLKYVAGFVAEPDEALLLAAVDAEPWLADLKRRVQHYGYRYDYKARKVDPTMHLGPLPAWAQPLANRLVADGHLVADPDQLIVNEYEPGQGIAAHVDCVPCFGPVVVSPTLVAVRHGVVRGQRRWGRVAAAGAWQPSGTGGRVAVQLAARHPRPQDGQDRRAGAAAGTAGVADVPHSHRRG